MPRVFVSPEARRRFALHLAVGLAVLVLLTGAVARHLEPLQDRGAIQRIVAELGHAGPLALLALHAIQTVLVPIPGQAIGVAGGYLFGALPGLLYTMAGVTIGSLAAFWLARRFGRPYLAKVFAPEVIERYDATVSKLGVAGITILVLFPGLPDDVVCFVCGTSDLSSRQFLVVVLLGRTPAYALAVFSGAEFGDERLYRGLGLAFLLLALSVLGYLERDRLRRIAVERFGSAS